MAVQKKRVSITKRRQRQSSSYKVTLPELSVCKCGFYKQPHTVCMGCGQYKGRQVLKIKDKK
ncbi:50S ribosomal protein L32 [Candidatus Nesciobacter abundans]|uniref:Large ribosomal subunit protein bL32 n=1 Tax=Candidatus Nesciobacter abundans TaxID=2601668 RepID=A0A5C0UGD5_9PROT|nr:50S ribosomal protein L32 [Candidatus Nesciobacter abundans]QEK39175.1 50S ribosomal protein L32 [Candidatus Nesciobacter abundans]